MMKLNFRSKGMTLIEVVVVVAVIAILSAIAIPAYGTYTTRSRVSECLSLLGPAKLAVSMRSTNFTFSPTNNCASIVIHSDGVIVATTQNTGADVDPILQLTPTFAGSVSWHCGLVAGKYADVPSICRNEPTAATGGDLAGSTAASGGSSGTGSAGAAGSTGSTGSTGGAAAAGSDSAGDTGNSGSGSSAGGTGSSGGSGSAGNPPAAPAGAADGGSGTPADGGSGGTGGEGGASGGTADGTSGGGSAGGGNTGGSSGGSGGSTSPVPTLDSCKTDMTQPICQTLPKQCQKKPGKSKKCPWN